MPFFRWGLWLISVTLTGNAMDLSVVLVAIGQLIVPPRVPGRESNREPTFWQAGALTT
jgi:hypothetical protein